MINKLFDEIAKAEYKYYKSREDYYNKKKILFINSNWEQINNERQEQGLDKLTSEKKREYYVDTQLQNEHEYYKSCELHYLALKRDFEFRMEQFIKG